MLLFYGAKNKKIFDRTLLSDAFSRNLQSYDNELTLSSSFIMLI